ncbi:MAG: MFS transporter [Anaerolineaceae bacterium]|nr:MFS transporter [Anaerolineaceae bacterium]
MNIQGTEKRKPAASINWFSLVILAVTGQIAWAVENTWFNTFVFDKITKDPRPIAWMVAASAVTATLTTLFMGTLSDRTRSKWGKRKPYILFGYIFWGLMTVLFPMNAFLKTSSLAVLGVILTDSLMTFFGSTANDAAFNAWTTDVSPSEKRGKVEGILNLCLFIAQIISNVAAGIFIDRFGYFIFFYVLGGLVMIAGLVAGLALREEPTDQENKPRKPYWEEIRELFSLDTIKQNRQLFVLLSLIMVTGIGMQVAFPYLIIYLNHYLGVSKTQYSIIGGAILIISGAFSIPFGLLADRWNKKMMLALAIIVSSLGCFLFGQSRSIPLLALAGVLWQAFSVAISIASVSWLKDLLPEESRGRFLGMRMIFWIALPMLIGPAIGSVLIRRFGVPATLAGESGYIPVPIIFAVGAVISFFALLPWAFLKNPQENALEGAE